MKSQIMKPLTEIPRSPSTPRALAKVQGETLKALRRAAAELDEKVDRLRADTDLNSGARSGKIGKLRKVFTDAFSGQWQELRQRGELARELLDAYFSPDSIMVRAEFAEPDVTASLTSVVAAQTVVGLHQAAIDCARRSDVLLAGVVLNETRHRLEAETIGGGDAEAVMRLCEAVPLPPDEIATREVLEGVVIGGLEADAIYRASASGQPEDPIARLQRHRRVEAVKGTSKRNEDADSERWTPERRRSAGLP